MKKIEILHAYIALMTLCSTSFMKKLLFLLTTRVLMGLQYTSPEKRKHFERQLMKIQQLGRL